MREYCVLLLPTTGSPITAEIMALVNPVSSPHGAHRTHETPQIKKDSYAKDSGLGQSKSVALSPPGFSPRGDMLIPNRVRMLYSGLEVVVYVRMFQPGSEKITIFVPQIFRTTPRRLTRLGRLIHPLSPYITYGPQLLVAAQWHHVDLC